VFYIMTRSSVEVVWRPMADKWKEEKLNRDQYGGLVPYVSQSYLKWLEAGNFSLFEPALERLGSMINAVLQDKINELVRRYKLPVGEFQLRLRLLLYKYFMPGSPGERAVLLVTNKIVWGLQDWRFKLIDKTPDWLRRLADRSGLLDAALWWESLTKQVVAPLIKVSGGSAEIKNEIAVYIENEAKQEIGRQLGVVGKLLLTHHISQNSPSA
jgi:hypothetical protein